MAEEQSTTDTTTSDTLETESLPTASSSENPKTLKLSAKFSSFLELRNAIERYQKENSVQLIVKDSKLLRAESTRKIMPKVYHLVNQNLMYHSITYCCKCHGELRQKPGTRLRNVGQKRLNCPMYMKFKLSHDFRKLVLFDINETHNHGIDPTTFQMTPRQQVYNLSKMRQNRMAANEADTTGFEDEYVNSLIKSAIRDVTSVSDFDYEPPHKTPRIKTEVEDHSAYHKDNDEDDEDDDNDDNSNAGDASSQSESPLDSEFSCSDSDEDEIVKHRNLLPYPIRLIGSAIQSSPELIASTKQLIDIQKAKLSQERQKLLLETKQLELANSKLELEIRMMEKSLAEEMGRDTTIYLQAS